MRSPIQPFMVLIWNLINPLMTISARKVKLNASKYGVRSSGMPSKTFHEPPPRKSGRLSTIRMKGTVASGLGKPLPWIGWLMMVLGRSSDA